MPKKVRKKLFARKSDSAQYKCLQRYNLDIFLYLSNFLVQFSKLTGKRHLDIDMLFCEGWVLGGGRVIVVLQMKNVSGMV
jgi:hypothetical protein